MLAFKQYALLSIMKIYYNNLYETTRKQATPNVNYRECDFLYNKLLRNIIFKIDRNHEWMEVKYGG